MKELIEWLNDWEVTTISKSQVLDKAKQLLEQERNTIIFFAWNWSHERADHKDLEEDFDETFNLK